MTQLTLDELKALYSDSRYHVIHCTSVFDDEGAYIFKLGLGHCMALNVYCGWFDVEFENLRLYELYLMKKE